jgi:DNA-binding MurR/RpiR family transcriptional regulator
MPPDVHALAERLRRDYERFSPAQQALARYLADHLADVPLLSAHDVAAAAHCSPATVVRFAQTLGYAGYPELQRTVRSAQRPALPARRASQLGLFSGGEGLEPAIAADRLALEDALSRIGAGGLGPLVAALADQSPLVLAGEGYARPVLALMEERLARAGRATVLLDGLEPRHRARLAALEPSAGVMAVAIGRETRVAEAALAAARSAGAPGVALVDSSLSSLARGALARVVPADERYGAPGLVAMVAVSQVLAAGLVPQSSSERPLLSAALPPGPLGRAVG